MKCSNCGHWNRVPVNKIFIEQNSPEAKVKKREYTNIFWETPI